MHAMPEEVDDKGSALEHRLRSLGDLMVAYSGGVDSAFLAWKAHQILGHSMLAVIADSPSLARKHLANALQFAEANKIPTKVLATAELQNPEYAKNDQLRCFHCKNELFTVMEAAKAELRYRHIAYGMNVDDRDDFRPGQTAARQHGVLAPLAEVGLTETDIRTLARRAGLSVWDKPASGCLSSRIAYGRPVNRETLARVEQPKNICAALV
jgi:pyridinium-3,5-biscarboxylic acid mononucleotide sulfurtransferase